MGVTRAGSFQNRTPDVPTHVGEYWFNGMPVGQQGGKDATTTGIKIHGSTPFVLTQEVLNQVTDIVLRVAKYSTSGGETTATQLYNQNTGTVVGSVSVTGSSTHTTGDIGTGLTAGDTYQVRWVVTSASSTSGATFTAQEAMLLLKKTEK